MKSTWSDIDLCLNHNTLAEQDKETLESFLLVQKPLTTNPDAHKRFDSAKELVRDRLRQIERDQSTDNPTNTKWHDHPVGKLALMIIGGLIVFVLSQLLKHGIPFLAHHENRWVYSSGIGRSPIA